MNLYKKAEAMLYNYKNTLAEIKNIRIEIDDIEQNYREISPIVYDDMPKAHNVSSSIEREIEHKERKIEHLTNLMMKKENQIRRMDNVLEALEERERNLIELRYFNKVPYSKIAEEFNLETSSIFRIRKETLDKVISLLFIQY